jgi:hypothetical protein
LLALLLTLLVLALPVHAGAQDFGALPIGQSSAAKSQTLTFTSAGTVGTVVALTQGAQGLDFAVASGGTCTVDTSYKVGNTCTVNVTFKPTLAGLRNGAVVLLDSSGNPLATAYVHGIGTGPQVSFLPGSQIPLGSNISTPFGVAVDGSGNVFVANGNIAQVQEILATGGYTTVNTLAPQFGSPAGLALDGAGNVFVGDYHNNAVYEILAPNYTTVKTLAPTFNFKNPLGVPVTGFNEPFGVAVDGSGNVFVADQQNHVVEEILAPNYTTINPYYLSSNPSVYNSFTPVWVAVDGSGNIFVGDIQQGAVEEMLAASSYTTLNTLASGFKFETGVAVDGNGNVFFTDAGSNPVSVKELLAADGYAVDTMVTYPLGSSFTKPEGIAVDGNGNVFVADWSNNLVAKLGSGDLLFIPSAPCRVADTRNATGPFGGPSIARGFSRSFVIPNSACSIPSTAAAYSLNVTVIPKAGLGYLTVWPTGVAQPVVSTLNSDGRVKANAAIVPAGTSGAISVYATDTTDVVLDINGYFVAATSTSALAFYPLTPCRIADTRNPTGALGGPSLVGMQTRAFPILSSACNIPSSAQAYSLNFTAVPQDGLGYLSAWPTGQAWPGVSTLNVPTTNPVVANAAIVPAGTSGEINVLGSNNTDVVIDINGYFALPGSAAGGQSLFTATPCRTLDTRSSSGSFNGTLAVNITSGPCGIPSSAQAFVLNATVVPTGGLGYLTLWPESEAQPVVSTLNADDGVIASNMAIVPTTNGSIDAFSSSSTQLILDISGYFAPGPQ